MKSSLKSLTDKIDNTTELIGRVGSFIILPMVLLTFLVVVLRYGFGFGRVWLQELILYLHATFFVLGVSYNLLKNSHVRVDVFYNKFSIQTQNIVTILGCLVFIVPVTSLIFFKSLPYVYQSFLVLESSPDAGGLPGRVFLKDMFKQRCVLVFSQSISQAIKSLTSLNGSKR